MKEKNDTGGGGGGGGYVRADQIDLKSLDEQLQKHLSRAWTMEKNKNREQEQEQEAELEAARRVAVGPVRRQEWEIDPSKLIVKGAIPRGTFGTVHRSIYNGIDVAVYRSDNGNIRAQHTNRQWPGETGTLGYMAPEVLNGNPYKRKCDVYSSGICLWEIYFCDMPYHDLSFSEVTSAVVRQNLRPEIPRCCPSGLANVMKRCWDANPDKRPEMDEVVAMLEAVDTTKGGGMLPHDHPQGCLCFRRYRGP